MSASIDPAALDSTALGITSIDLTAIGPVLRLDRHLPECPTGQARPITGTDDQIQGGPDDSCDWCRWAIDGAGVHTVVDAIADLGALASDYDRRRGDVSVPWVVASAELLNAPRPQPADALIPSTADLLARLHHALSDRATPLARRLDTAVAAGGPVEQRCLNSAGPLAAAALQRPEHAALREQLPRAVRSELDRAATLLSADNQTAGLLAMVEAQHWDGVPALRTQPAWARRSSPGSRSDPSAPTERSRGSGDDRRCARPVRSTARTAPSTGSGPAAGSFESLVVESVIDVVTEQIQCVAGELADALPRTLLQRDPHRAPLSERTRLLTWRIARIDWHLTFVDTGRTDCWQLSTPHDHDDNDKLDDLDGDTMGLLSSTTRCPELLVPWTVALAIDECERGGLVSATHQSRP